ncbi:uncharacterized protein BO80DRAFT_348644 [Aspergillus ibericus CBS 121593]|uniref:ABM domain-containing protein n=1 Tax=Aspergillus ibericus CBS 121593 TaxID=1448316 RepID=A0A395HD12_9EURO|nr:hypothetical protein BO80DRAFT_348644 [Aspergillus ibericus CBS 121593]RAL04124.1 hypothetical protein BO80DRAFT_348644 [Aspergillus ibericus CBS 121593]
MPPLTRARAHHKFPDFVPDASSEASPLALRQPQRTGRHTKLLDWIILNPGTGAAPHDETDPINQLFRLLFEESDYRYHLRLRRSCPGEAPHTEWLMLAWNSADLRAKFINSPHYQYFIEILTTWASDRSVQVSMIDLTQSRGAFTGGAFWSTQYIGPVEYYELMAVYFPESLTGTQIQKLDKITPYNLGVLIGTDVYPLAGLTDWQHGWLDQPVLFQGQRARCLVYLMRWEDTKREREYKRCRFTIEGQDVDYWGEFVTPLKECGMLGYESQHASFLRNRLGSVLGA